MDRISELPSGIIHQIMSYLSPIDLVRTTVLSKKWNDLHKAFPILNFDHDKFLGKSRTSVSKFKRFQRTNTFLKLVDVSLYHFCQNKLHLQTLRLSMGLSDFKGLPPILDDWLSLAFESKVKELAFNVKPSKGHIYTLPQTIYFVEFLTTLELSGCRLVEPSDNIKLYSVTSMTLRQIFATRKTIERLTNNSPLLEEMILDQCRGFEGISVSCPSHLKVLKILTDSGDLSNVQIVAPHLQLFKLFRDKTIAACAINLIACPNLRDLDLVGAELMDQEFHNLISKLFLLENLSVSSEILRKVKISSHHLKNLKFEECHQLKEIELDTPNLVSFTGIDIPCPDFPINAPCPWKLEFRFRGDPGTVWFLNVKRFLGMYNRVEDLGFGFMSRKVCLYISI